MADKDNIKSIKQSIEQPNSKQKLGSVKSVYNPFKYFSSEVEDLLKKKNGLKQNTNRDKLNC